MTLPPATPWHGAALGGVWTAVGVLVLAYFLVAEPLLGRRLHTRFLEQVRSQPGRRSRHYLLLIGFEIALGAGALVLVAILPGISLPQVGLRLPPPDPTGFRDGLVTSFLVVVVPAAVVVTVLQRRGRFPAPAGGEAVAAMLPRTRTERGAFLVLSLLAGVCEELAYRGLVLAVLAALVPPVPVLAVITAGAILFGVAHLYQGPAGAAVAALLGLGLGGFYWFTGSLLLVMAFHVVLDARQAFTLPSRDAAN